MWIFIVFNYELWLLLGWFFVIESCEYKKNAMIIFFKKITIDICDS
jgi:hypothetical protein